MPPQPMAHAMAHTTRPNDDPEPGKIKTGDAILEGGNMILGLVSQASKLSGIPYLSDAAGIALKLVQIAQAVKENKEGFQGLVDDSTDIVAVFYRSYQGAENQDEWLNSEGIRAAAKDLERCLESILKLGEKMKARGLVRRTLCYTIDAGTIKKYRQRLQSSLSVFDVAAQLDSRDLLVQIRKNTEELLNEAKHQSTSSGTEVASETSANRVELRARQRIQIEEVKSSGISFGAGNVVVENGRAAGASESGRSTPQSHKNRRPSPTPSPSPETRPDIRVKGVYSSGIAFGDGDVSVGNW